MASNCRYRVAQDVKVSGNKRQFKEKRVIQLGIARILWQEWQCLAINLAIISFDRSFKQ
jgi:hypothetical protein